MSFFSVPPSAAKRAALARAISASRPIFTKAVFSRTPVSSEARNKTASSISSVVLILLNMSHAGASVKGGIWFEITSNWPNLEPIISSVSVIAWNDLQQILNRHGALRYRATLRSKYANTTTISDPTTFEVRSASMHFLVMDTPPPMPLRVIRPASPCDRHSQKADPVGPAFRACRSDWI